MSSAKERIKETLDSGGSVSAADIGAFAKPKPEEEAPTDEPKKDVMNEDSVMTVPQEAKNSPVETVGAQVPSPAQQTAAAMDRMSGILALDLEEEIVITAKEKQLFLDSLVTGDRFTLPFSLFDGRLRGKFQNRTNRESDAIMHELSRWVSESKLVTNDEHASAFRSAMFAFQLKQLNGEEFAVPAEPLIQRTTFDDDTGRANTENPTWLEAAVDRFTDMQDGVLAALYREVILFERKYWTMVKNAANQNFWKPEDSISA